MCEFISFVERRGKVYFLTGEQILSERGQRWVKENNVSPDDYCGHGTIRLWYKIDNGDGIDRECTDFTSPANFPDVIAKAIKDGEMRGLGVATELLTQPAGVEYEKIRQQAGAEYDKIRQPAGVEYVKIRQQAGAKYDKIVQPARAEYEKIVQPARAEYEKIVQQAWAEYEKIRQQAFWDLFARPENRIEVWR